MFVKAIKFVNFLIKLWFYRTLICIFSILILLLIFPIYINFFQADPYTHRLNNLRLRKSEMENIFLLFDQVQHSEDFTLDLRKQQSKSSFSETYTRFWRAKSRNAPND
jgi:ABC-type bacteriocin/lantibiotic exporter with double-glycine peptidase domain